jgi:hypothetical protein
MGENGRILAHGTDLDKTMNPAPAAIPTNQQPDIPQPDTTDEAQ